MCHQQDGFWLTWNFVLFMFESINLKYLKFLQYIPKIKPIISKDMWPNVFRPKVGSYFPYFLVTYWHYILFFIVCNNFPLTLKSVRYWNLLWVDYQLNRINSIKNIISCAIMNQTLNTTWINVLKIAYSNQASRFTIIKLFDCNWIPSI